MPHLRARGLSARNSGLTFAPWSRRRSHDATRGGEPTSAPDRPLFENPFAISDLAVFDDEALGELLPAALRLVDTRALAHAMSEAERPLVERVRAALPETEREAFARALAEQPSPEQTLAARRRVLDHFFWELTYWKTPALYERLTEGERLHPGIFKRLGPLLRDKTVLDAGAGCGRATFACLRRGARRVYAVEPSPGLRRILTRKLATRTAATRVTVLAGRFERLPLPDHAVDVALSCAAFTAQPGQGGDEGLSELRRVTRPGGVIALIWPRQEDADWLRERGFSWVVLPAPREMGVRYRSLATAVRVARRFYARNRELHSYLLRWRRPEAPFAVVGFNPPRDFCWLHVPGTTEPPRFQVNT